MRRGLSNMRIQAYLTAAIINLKRLAASCVLTLLMAMIDALTSEAAASGTNRRRVTAKFNLAKA